MTYWELGALAAVQVWAPYLGSTLLPFTWCRLNGFEPFNLKDKKRESSKDFADFSLIVKG